MANVINATSTGNGGLVSTGDDSGILNIQTNETNAITVDASQNVGIGTTSPNRTGFTSPVLSVTNGTSGVLELIGTQSSDGTVGQLAWYNNSATSPDRIAQILGLRSGANNSGAITFQTNSAGGGVTERMRIDSSGKLLIGTTSLSAGRVNVLAAAGASGIVVQVTNNGDYGLAFNNASGTNVGRIQIDSGSTSYVTSSDYRLKENIAPMTGALAKVAQLKPVTYKWKVDGTDGQGFIAHELQAVVPDCVSGEKDEVDENGDIKPQGIDTSFLVATLTAAIQELKAINDTQAETINALTARIVALEQA